MASEQWAKGDVPRPDRGQAVAEGARVPEGRQAGEDDVEIVARDYVVEVSGKRFAATVHGEATAALAAPQNGAAPRAAPKRDARAPRAVAGR